jgi:hypothetical protein
MLAIVCSPQWSIPRATSDEPPLPGMQVLKSPEVLVARSKPLPTIDLADAVKARLMEARRPIPPLSYDGGGMSECGGGGRRSAASRTS